MWKRLTVLTTAISAVLVFAAVPSAEAGAATWTEQQPPEVGGLYGSLLSGVSCVDRTWCMAVGAADDGLATRWDGTSWTSVPLPSPPPHSSVVPAAVSCTSRSSCVAVGTTERVGSKRNHLAAILRWNGRRWLFQNPGGVRVGYLEGVSCVSAKDCFAVGQVGDSDGPLVERWDGTSWTVQQGPDPASVGDVQAISCTSATSCVGMARGPDHSEPLTVVWDGSTWTVHPIDIDTEGLSCVAADDCFAVGERFARDGRTMPAAARWDGTRWTNFPRPPLDGVSPPPGATLLGVSCSSATACTAVGSEDGFGVGGPAVLPFSEIWNGTGWRYEPAVYPTDQYAVSLMRAVSCVAPRLCTGVGFQQQYTQYSQQLVERRSP